MSSTLAVRGGEPVRTRPYPTWPTSDNATAEAVGQVLASGKWGSTHGEVVATFEAEFAEYQQAAHGICVCNGTLALAAALRAVGVGVGDEVIVPPYTFIASAAAVTFVGAIPVFADIEEHSHLLSPAAAEAAITERTKAIMPVHIAGRPCDMDAFVELGQRRGLAIIEDAAQAAGAEWKGRRVGAIGDVGTFSFQTSKNMSAGEGGACVTNSPDIAGRLYAAANVGRVPGGGWYQHDHLGYNLRLTEFQAAILREQLRQHPSLQAVRAANGTLLRSLLGSVEGVALPSEDPSVTAHGWHLFLLRLPSIGGVERKKEFTSALQAEGVPCSPGYDGLHRNPALLEEVEALCKRLGQPVPVAEVPVSERLSEDTIWLPQNVLLGSEDDIRDAAAAIEKVARGI
ncbi:DegT/DnrJ/EryC1/StrS family aminotransferase [Tenggerimyces flavus]|uniref:DegT/DnrJ/EryC1/StrS family aminotransferase n=1 Tax=Tenggerimyces flavus TaxID=1708749 RepID=A0ABV7YPW0_9ACTN|nr:DegT/DnrJ/EryC1/StrS family aminotransferase [Tenggerimyces flavus]MBM7789475.1 dTDP-4-amino-4,6-dideoxygalactose transaminase [Tenggerimyces flavus]